eukprot:GHVR01028208.1.p1 GENE.GHVR01028208.1~~GHVR01028208.1.p1  ORF type:complete len:191 (-),score=29.44 GHVR01028208.1:100-672(-)
MSIQSIARVDSFFIEESLRGLYVAVVAIPVLFSLVTASYFFSKRFNCSRRYRRRRVKTLVETLMASTFLFVKLDESDKRELFNLHCAYDVKAFATAFRFLIKQSGKLDPVMVSVDSLKADEPIVEAIAEADRMDMTEDREAVEADVDSSSEGTSDEVPEDVVVVRPNRICHSIQEEAKIIFPFKEVHVRN